MTPLLSQYHKIKDRYKDHLLLFRLGDFYEMFFDDAKLASQILDIVLTKRNKEKGKDVPMCGIPYHAADNYIARLVKAGKKVAIAEQIGDPKQSKGIVKRKVVKVITPGTILEANMLEEHKNNYLLSIALEKGKVAIVHTDISSSTFSATLINIESDGDLRKAKDEIEKIDPSEIVVVESLVKEGRIYEMMGGNQEQGNLSGFQKPDRFNEYITTVPDHVLDFDFAKEIVLKNFGVHDLHPLGLKEDVVIRALSSLLYYINENRKIDAKNIFQLKQYSVDDKMILDQNTIDHLDIISNTRNAHVHSLQKHSLFSLFHKTVTAGGARMLYRFFLEPLIESNEIQKRLDSVQYFVEHSDIRDQLRELFKDFADLERISSRIASGLSNPREILRLGESLKKVPEIQNIECRMLNMEYGYQVKSYSSKFTVDESSENIPKLVQLQDVVALIESSILPEPSVRISDGNIIRSSYHGQVQELRELSENSQATLRNLEASLKEKYQIPSLKIKYNKIFGYYIEVTNTHLTKVPSEFIERQTLVNSKRYTLPKLQELESKILNAREQLIALEQKIYFEILEKIRPHLKTILKNAEIVSYLDVISTFAQCTADYQLVRAKQSTDDSIFIKDGRHLLVEQHLPEDQDFIPNDLKLNQKDQRVMILTGPNMAGKSTYLRQNALILFLNQIGSFVPASQAVLPVVDRIFTRIGASDKISENQSTFMVEMNEVSMILKNATEKSFIILDEVGRGTSTFDGISIAWAVLKFINSKLKAKTLFSTHYHELLELGKSEEGVRNFSIMTSKQEEDLVFLRKVVAGGMDDSFGIEVAKMAGIDGGIIQEAEEKLEELEKQSHVIYNVKPETQGPKKKSRVVVTNTSCDSKILESLKKVDLDNMTPVEAMAKLSEIKVQSEKLKIRS